MEFLFGLFLFAFFMFWSRRMCAFNLYPSDGTEQDRASAERKSKIKFRVVNKTSLKQRRLIKELNRMRSP